MCCEWWTDDGLESFLAQSELGDSCGDKMGQMEGVENVWMYFIAADNVMAAGQSSDFSV